ncbi:MAG: hypothetical protein JWN78_749 [Bacteroidota bacterium]|nr:hypothetical protein [Bacteroidota bacterium]
MEEKNIETSELNKNVFETSEVKQLPEIVTTGEINSQKQYLIKFSNQSDILNWQHALNEFEVQLVNTNCGRITGDTVATPRILHKSFIAVDETSALQLLLNLGKKHDTTGRIKIVRVDGETQTVIFNRSSKVYK